MVTGSAGFYGGRNDFYGRRNDFYGRRNNFYQRRNNFYERRNNFYGGKNDFIWEEKLFLRKEKYFLRVGWDGIFSLGGEKIGRPQAVRFASTHVSVCVRSHFNSKLLDFNSGEIFSTENFQDSKIHTFSQPLE